MFMGFLAILVVASAALFGGQFKLLGRVRLRLAWLILASLLVQVLITDIVPGWPRWLLIGLHLATYVAAGVTVWLNRKIPGILLLGFGAFLNAITITLNDGTLPASARALKESGIIEDKSDFVNSGVIAHPLLPWLGDTMATPPWLPFRNVISVGDLIIALGAAVLVHSVTKSWLYRGSALVSRRAGAWLRRSGPVSAANR